MIEVKSCGLRQDSLMHISIIRSTPTWPVTTYVKRLRFDGGQVDSRTWGFFKSIAKALAEMFLADVIAIWRRSRDQTPYG